MQRLQGKGIAFKDSELRPDIHSTGDPEMPLPGYHILTTKEQICGYSDPHPLQLIFHEHNPKIPLFDRIRTTPSKIADGGFYPSGDKQDQHGKDNHAENSRHKSSYPASQDDSPGINQLCQNIQMEPPVADLLHIAVPVSQRIQSSGTEFE